MVEFVSSMGDDLHVKILTCALCHKEVTITDDHSDGTYVGDLILHYTCMGELMHFVIELWNKGVMIDADTRLRGPDLC